MRVRPLAAALMLPALVLGFSTAPAVADTPPFPDLAAYTPVNPTDYGIDFSRGGLAYATQIYFLAPGDMQCKFNRPIFAVCTGRNLPGFSRESSSIGSFRTDTGFALVSSDNYHRDNAVRGIPIRDLPPFHSISVDDVTCGVDGSGTTACEDPRGRAFIISPAGARSLYLWGSGQS